MKKTLSSLLLLSLVIGMAGCGASKNIKIPEQTKKSKQLQIEKSVLQEKEQARIKKAREKKIKEQKENREYQQALNTTSQHKIDLWKRFGFSPSEAGEWVKLKNSNNAFHIWNTSYWEHYMYDDKDNTRLNACKKWKDNNFTMNEAQSWIDKGYSNPKDAQKIIAYNNALIKGNKLGASSLDQNECQLLSADMITIDGKTQCNYENLKWNDVKLCSIELKKFWRKAGYTPFETKAWTDAGVSFPNNEIFEIWVRQHYRKGDRALGGKDCYKKTMQFCVVGQRNEGCDYPNEWDSPSEAKKVHSLGFRNLSSYKKWSNAGLNDYEISKWIRFGFTTYSQVKKFTDFGITLNTALKYISVGVTPSNIDDYKNMSYEDIALEFEEESKSNAKALARINAENKKKSNAMKLIGIGKYTCTPFMGFPISIDVGTTSIEFQGYKELFLIDVRKDYNRYVGIDDKGKKTTFDIVTNLTFAKENLTNASVEGINITCELVK